ncbi:MAG: hypothetical protein KAW12_17360 [Candidatus Aminicenantes bacterium]|nr:hypothetical protein [Candidatus Aminicenantes bacterium]
MKCLKESLMILYMDKTLPEKKMKQAQSHLSGCPECRSRLKKLETGLDAILRKMDLLAPGVEQRPALDAAFILPGQPRKKLVSVDFFDFFKPRLILKWAVPAAAAVIVFVLLWVLPFSRPGTGDFLPAAEAGQFSIQSIKMEEKPVQAYVIKDEDSKTTLIWLEAACERL